MSDIQNLPHRNHYVPQFYLKVFSQDSQRIFRLEKPSSIIQHLPIPVVGFQSNLYTYKNKSGDKESLEDLFKEIESLAAYSIQKLRNSLILSDQEKADLSVFISSQMVRTPAFKAQLLSSHTELMENIMRKRLKMTMPSHIQSLLKEHGKDVNLEEAADIIDFGINEERSKLKIDYPDGFWIKHMLKLSVDLCPVFQICDWEIRHSVTKFGFLTSDHPFMLVAGEKPDFYGVGLLTPKAKKVIPLAADICLIAHEPSKAPIILHTKADKEFFSNMNKRTIRNAERYVFSSDGGKIEKLIKHERQLLVTPKRYTVSEL